MVTGSPWYPSRDNQSWKYLQNNSNRLLAFFTIILSQADREVFQVPHERLNTEQVWELQLSFIKLDIKEIWVEKETLERNSRIAECIAPSQRVKSQLSESYQQGKLVPCPKKVLWECAGIRGTGCIIWMGPRPLQLLPSIFQNLTLLLFDFYIQALDLYIKAND